MTCSDYVLLPKIVRFVGRKSLEICQISSWMTKCDTRFSLRNLKCLHTGDGSNISYFKEYRSALNVTWTQRQYDDPCWPRVGNDLSVNIFRQHFYMWAVCRNICDTFPFSPERDRFTFSLEYMWSSKVKMLCLGTFSETSRCAAVSFPASDMAWWLRNNWGNKRRHTCSMFNKPNTRRCKMSC